MASTRAPGSQTQVMLVGRDFTCWAKSLALLLRERERYCVCVCRPEVQELGKTWVPWHTWSSEKKPELVLSFYLYMGSRDEHLYPPYPLSLLAVLDQTGLDLPVSASQMPGLKICTTTARWAFSFFNYYHIYPLYKLMSFMTFSIFMRFGYW